MTTDEQGEWNDPPGVSVDDSDSPADEVSNSDARADEYPATVPDRYIYMYAIGSVAMVVGFVGIFAVGALAVFGELNTPLLLSTGAVFVAGFTLTTIHDTKVKIELQRERRGGDGDGGDR